MIDESRTVTSNLPRLKKKTTPVPIRPLSSHPSCFLASKTSVPLLFVAPVSEYRSHSSRTLTFTELAVSADKLTSPSE
ncbi:hypothetical protein Pla52n_55780 [Stieleria varia]|uniref:Uncharacterized protein n=1 Tax=Stieleria varia TaxID=2528005 RepID=A0A5C6A305_9BACT|nr:hypothetical protein Pla52n_55780 [Stieleria varia]